MKTVLIAIAALLALTGCATPPTGTATMQSPQDIAAKVCPAAQITITSLAALDGLDATAKAGLAKAAPLVKAVCDAGGTVNLANLQTLAGTALPLLVQIVEAAPLDPATHDSIVLGLTAGQIVLEGIMQAQSAP